MSKEMEYIALKNIIDFKNGKIATKSSGNIPIYGGNGILGYTDSANYENIIIIGRVGAYCGSVYIESNKCWVSDNAIAGVPKDYELNTYNYYLLKCLDLNSKNIGSSQPLLTQGILNSINIKVHKEKIIKLKIAKVLSTLDAKIELNNRINKELEAMAKTLYDYWFVQFDFPNVDGKPYKSSGGTMVYNEELKREIPEGWKVDSLWNIANYFNGLPMQKHRPVNEHYLRVIKIKEMNEGYSDNTEFAKADIPKEAIIENGDILFSWSATLDVKMWANGKGALNQHIFKVTSDKYPKVFYFFELLNYLQHFKMMADLRKTTMGHITQEHLKQSKIAIPPMKLIEKIEKTINPILEKKLLLEQQSQNLTQLRDFLLPMLMNGQVSVKS